MIRWTWSFESTIFCLMTNVDNPGLLAPGCTPKFYHKCLTDWWWHDMYVKKKTSFPMALPPDWNPGLWPWFILDIFQRFNSSQSILQWGSFRGTPGKIYQLWASGWAHCSWYGQMSRKQRLGESGSQSNIGAPNRQYQDHRMPLSRTIRGPAASGHSIQWSNERIQCRHILQQGKHSQA